MWSYVFGGIFLACLVAYLGYSITRLILDIRAKKRHKLESPSDSDVDSTDK